MTADLLATSGFDSADEDTRKQLTFALLGVAEDGTCTAEDVMIVEDAWSGMAP